MEKQIICNATHTKFQPSDDEWKCPKCGAGNDKFTIIENADRSHIDCTLVHNDDYVNCEDCDYSSSGRSLAARMAKIHKTKMVKCAHCAGKGWIRESI